MILAAGQQATGAQAWQGLVAHWNFGVLAAVVVAASITDVRAGKVYNRITYPAIAIGLGGHALAGWLAGDGAPAGVAVALAGLLLGSTLVVAWLAGGIGAGDVKLMAGIGALMGWRFALATMFYGFLVAALMAVIVMVRRRIVKRTMGRVWRFLVLAFTPGKPADPATPDSPKIPFGLALCIGSVVAVVEALWSGTAALKLLGI